MFDIWWHGGNGQKIKCDHIFHFCNPLPQPRIILNRTARKRKYFSEHICSPVAVRQMQWGVTAVISNWFSVVRPRSLRLNQCSSHVQTAHSVRGRVHLKWIRGSYNKHSHKTIITQPSSTVPSRYSSTTARCCARSGNVLSTPKKYT